MSIGLFHLFEFALDGLEYFHVVVEGFFHLLIYGRDVVDGVFLLFLVLVDDFEFDFVEAFSVVDDVAVGLVKLGEFGRRVL